MRLKQQRVDWQTTRIDAIQLARTPIRIQANRPWRLAVSLVRHFFLPLFTLRALRCTFAFFPILALTLCAPTTFATNHPPVAVTDGFAISTVAIPNVLNVITNNFDPDGQQVLIVGFTPPGQGTVAVISNAMVLSYTPGPNFHCDSFTYTIADGNSWIDVGLTVASADNTGIPPQLDVKIYSDEDDQEPGNNGAVLSPDARIIPPRLWLRAERS